MNSHFYARFVPSSKEIQESNGSSSTLEPTKSRKRRLRDESQSESPHSEKKQKVKRDKAVLGETPDHKRQEASSSRSSHSLSKTTADPTKALGEDKTVRNSQARKTKKSKSIVEEAEKKTSEKRSDKRTRAEESSGQSGGTTSGDSNLKEVESSRRNLNHNHTSGKTEEADPKDTQVAQMKDRNRALRGEKDKNNIDLRDKRHAKIHSKFQKSLKAAAGTSLQRLEENIEKPVEQIVESHGLVPLPQPPPALDPEKPAFTGLPSWLAHPIRVSLRDKRAFEELNIGSKIVSNLKSKGYNEAFAVQATIVPLLLTGPERYFGDICVSAATGSGKTLAYVLPMIESLRTRIVTQLRGLIVVPTRELVKQVREVCELCASGTGLHIGTAIGSRSLREEQDMLMQKWQRYDPERYRNQRNRLVSEEDWAKFDLQSLLSSAKEEDVVPDHVLEYTSKVDILICTPGRLVDHVRSTKSFNLDAIQWLVIDEADRLVNESFQEWVDVVIGALNAEKAYSDMRPAEKLLADLKIPPVKRNIQKIICSATMTRDLAKLNSLDLKHPKMVVIGNPQLPDLEAENAEYIGASGNDSLPMTLKEFAITIKDESQKPLFLLELLLRHINVLQEVKPSSQKPANSSSSSDSSDSESDSESTSVADSTSLESSESSSDSSLDRHSEAIEELPKPRVLIFTSSTAATHRLAHLLKSLIPALSSHITTLTKIRPSRRALSSLISPKSPIRIAIATDRAARGLDIPFLSHVISYDVPTSLTAYVHRVGRTARAGREGNAWNLISWREGKWWWSEIGNGGNVKRAQKVRRMKIDLEVDEQRRREYETALKKLEDDVKGFDERRGSK